MSITSVEKMSSISTNTSATVEELYQVLLIAVTVVLQFRLWVLSSDIGKFIY